MTTIVRLTIVEAARRRLLWALLGLTCAVVVLTAWGFERLVALARSEGLAETRITLGVSQTLILVAFMFSFVLAMTATFAAAPAIGAEIESGTALAILARPIRRAEYVVGRWLGLIVVVVAYAVGSGLIEIAAVRLVSGYAPPDPVGAVGYLSAEAAVVLTLSLALGTRLPALAAGAIVVVIFGLAWFAGVLGGIGALFGAPALVTLADASRVVVPIDGLWRGVVYSLEPGEVLLLALTRGQALEANPFFASDPPAPSYVAWAVAWVAGALALASASFGRRDL